MSMEQDALRQLSRRDEEMIARRFKMVDSGIALGLKGLEQVRQAWEYAERLGATQEQLAAIGRRANIESEPTTPPPAPTLRPKGESLLQKLKSLPSRLLPSH